MKHVFTLLTLILCLSPALAQRQRAQEPLETGFERKLGVIYKTVGERSLALDIYYPEVGTKSPSPVIVYTHGGGWAAGSRL